ncbi:hypothetical protein DPMN_081034 [Dreissena polymorpha]|uniref:Uncharacterized protein n=1 Tax=Dreissena polymorpha TaxID=45954 RepID=A0A9D3Y5N3_DREPO|nr:hypothetical protein DPMN_081034 [Dreissena polymorpha]
MSNEQHKTLTACELLAGCSPLMLVEYTVDSANTGLSEYRKSPDSERSGKSRIFPFYFCSHFHIASERESVNQ